jgi:hypothetical protein
MLKIIMCVIITLENGIRNLLEIFKKLFYWANFGSPKCPFHATLPVIIIIKDKANLSTFNLNGICLLMSLRKPH